MPATKFHRHVYKISGIANKEKKLYSAIEQAQRYCSDKGIKYAIVTNGYSFGIFKAVSETSPWREGKIVIFESSKYIKENFIAFYNLLNYENIHARSLDKEFISYTTREKNYNRPISHINNPNALYGRNEISSLLQPYISQFFGDISTQTNSMILERCYVYSGSLKIIDDDLNLVIEDEIPNYAKKDGFITIKQETKEDNFQNNIANLSITNKTGGFVIIMGGIGCGKSTYIRRFIQKFNNKYTDATKFIYLNYLAYSPEIANIKDYTFDLIKKHIIENENILDRKILENLFETEINILKQTKLYGITDSQILNERIGEFLFSEIQNSTILSEKYISTLIKLGKIPIVIFDNVDQLSIDIQTQIFTLAQYFSQRLNSLVILSLREESYCTAKLQKIITAYTVNKYHISSPSFEKMINLRIKMAIETLDSALNTEINVNGRQVTTRDVTEFIKIIHENLLRTYRPIYKFLTSISYGNMRFALEMLNSFMTSGATDVAKILKRHLETQSYTVAFHEFVKSVALGEYRFYKESRSPIINIFDIQNTPISSHFTGIRLLSYLAHRRNIASTEGEGFIELSTIFNIFDDIFGDTEDLKKTILKFITTNNNLVELDTRLTDTIEEATYIRATPSGIYYSNFLYKEFVYLDLVLQDTPFNDFETSKFITHNMSTSDIEQRFRRVEKFIDYLKNEESIEFSEYSLSTYYEPFSIKFSEKIARSFSQKKSYIREKKQNNDN